MKTTRLLLLLPSLVFASIIPAEAGDGPGFYHRESVTACMKQKRHCPLEGVGRVVETFLHWPQILSEGIEGDRALVNKRGILAPREMPVEERIISPED